MKSKLLKVFLICAVAFTPFTMRADDASKLASQISTISGGDLIATVSGNTVTVTGSFTAPATLPLDIDTGITVEWGATISADAGFTGSDLINLSGSGTFNVETGIILTIPTGLSFSVNSAVTVNNNGIIINNGTIYNDGTINNSGLIVTESGGISNGSNPLVTLTLDANGGTGTITVAEPTTSFDLSKLTTFSRNPVYSPNQLIGWASVNTGATSYISNPYTFTNGETIYAQWGRIPAITTTYIPEGTFGEAYSHTLTATGGGLMTWSISAGTLPAGLLLNASTGIISGTPTAAGWSNFTLKVSNGTTSDATRTFVMVVEARPVIVYALGGNSKYGESPENPGISFKGLFSGADLSSFEDLYNNFNISDTTSVGSYILEVEGEFDDPNYKLKRDSGIWVVNKATGSFVDIQTLIIIYIPALTLADIELPEGYAWSSPKTSLNVGNYQNFAATYTDPSGNYTSASGTIQVTVRKANGANLSGAPTLKGTATTSSISVNELTLPDNPGKQTVEYAISIYGTLIDAPTSAALDALKWQSGTTFTGDFSENTNYYFYARSGRNTNYNSGPAQVSVPIKVGDITGINEISEIKELKAWILDGILYVSGLTPGKTWSVYNISGMLIYKDIATNVVETLRATSLRMGHGIYIVKSGNQTIKVVH